MATHSGSHQTDFETLLDTLPKSTTTTITNSKNGIIETKTVCYEKGHEYTVQAMENGTKVTFRICELIERPTISRMHESVAMCIDRKIVRDRMKLKCRQCGKLWTKNEKGLERIRHHIRIEHMNVISCNECGVQFESQQLMQVHQLSHQVQCYGCKKRFTRKADLQMHLKSSIRCAKDHKVNANKKGIMF